MVTRVVVFLKQLLVEASPYAVLLVHLIPPLLLDLSVQRLFVPLDPNPLLNRLIPFLNLLLLPLSLDLALQVVRIAFMGVDIRLSGHSAAEVLCCLV